MAINEQKEAFNATHTQEGNGIVNPASYDKNAMSPTVLADYEDEDVPLLYFHNPCQFFFWVCSWAIPGMGMFCEAYYIFSIGNIKPLIQNEYPSCWKSFQNGCSKTLTQVPEYIQIVGIIFGMITLGYIGDKIGRKWGSVFTVSIMFIGAILLTSLTASSQKGFVIFYIIAQFIFGYGVGGEYPMAAGSAAERAEAGGAKKAKTRGREVVLTFSMQGVGNFTNIGVLLILFKIFNADRTYKSGKPATTHYYGDRLALVWRLGFALGMIPLAFMIFWRVFILKESVMYQQREIRSKQEKRGDLFRLFYIYWPRLLATAGTWFLWDYSFYGNKVFQSDFIKILSPSAGLITTLLWTLLNSGVALIGYWVAAAFVDNLYGGRLRIQLFGFLFVAILFYVSAAAFHPLESLGGIRTFQFVYFFSSFWGQFGPNCTTFLLAGELYPTEVRTTAHGFSAGVAKVGALVASVWFNYLGNRKKFWFTASANIAGFFLTLAFCPEPLRVSLAEVDRRWSYLRAGRTYHGEAINPKSLSYWERMTGEGRNYDPIADEQDRRNESWNVKGGGAHGHQAPVAVV